MLQNAQRTTVKCAWDRAAQFEATVYVQYVCTSKGHGSEGANRTLQGYLLDYSRYTWRHKYYCKCLMLWFLKS